MELTTEGNTFTELIYISILKIILFWAKWAQHLQFTEGSNNTNSFPSELGQQTIKISLLDT